jgi:citrate synthase
VSAIRIIAKLSTLVAVAQKYCIGKLLMYPRNALSNGANFNRMMFSNPCEEYKFNDVLVRALASIQSPHADYVQSASNSTMRLAGRLGA